jgi:pimeloyl-ACP methyl ester carboxylesterase
MPHASAALTVSTVVLDGCPVTVTDVGEGPAPPLVLLHGHTGSRHDFDGVVEDLAATRRVLAPDNRGHGDSPGPEDEAAYALVPSARWLLALLDALGLDEVVLLGHSYGGLIAQRVGLLASERLAGLVLMDTGLGSPREVIADLIARIAVTARDESLRAAHDLTVRSYDEARTAGALPPAIGPAPSAEETAAQRAAYERLAVPALVGGARAIISAAPPLAFLHGIDVPVLVVHGGQDAIWTATEQALLARTVRGARRVAIEGAAHSPQREQREAWLEAVGGFLDGLGADVGVRSA